MQALKELGQDSMLLCVLLELVQHLEMFFENILVCIVSERDVNLSASSKLINAALNLQCRKKPGLEKTHV
jgi:hypothetical protein